MSADHVVTVTMESKRWDPVAGDVQCFSTQEIYRGNEQECERIAVHLGGAYDERQKIISFTVKWGTLAAWERHLKEWDEACNEP